MAQLQAEVQIEVEVEGRGELEKMEVLKKKAKKRKDKVVEEDKEKEEEEVEEVEEKKAPITLVATNVACDQCWKVGVLCLYKQCGKVQSCHLCYVKKSKCETDRQPSNGPILAPSQARHSSVDSPFNCHIWSANSGAAGLSDEELLNMLLLEV
ncbi:hypothetical protein BV20DRAFT_1053302 [Pilatotrama ljubarskyi]|nr:hypothetical protein BV20DRAFT_1053302 [Pilatotrama ljubarskyi]